MTLGGGERPESGVSVGGLAHSLTGGEDYLTCAASRETPSQKLEFYVSGLDWQDIF